MRLEALKLVMRIDDRIAVVEPNRESNVDNPIAHAVDPRSAEGVRIERPAQRVNHRARREAIIGHFPEFLESYRVDLGIGILVELQAVNHLLGKRAAHAFAQYRYPRSNIHSRLKVRFRVAGLVYPFIPGAN